MVREKTLRFQGKNKGPRSVITGDRAAVPGRGLQDPVEERPTREHHPDSEGRRLAGHHHGRPRVTIVIAGDSNDFTIHVGIGKFIQGFAIAAVETILLTELFLVVDVPEALWTVHVENDIIKKITTLVG